MAGKGAALAMILSARDEGVAGVLSGVEKQVSGFGETLKGAFASLGALGIVEGITSGIGSIVGSAVEAADATGRLQAQLGLTAEQAAELGQVAQNVFRGGFGESAGEVNAALATVRQNLGDIGTEAAQSATEAALTLKDLFGAAETESTRTVSVMMKNFDGLSQTQAFDLITAGFQQGGDYSGELLDTLREYSPQFAKMGMSAEQMMGVLISGAQAGAFNLDKVGDAVKEFAIRSIDGSKATKEGFAAIGLDADQMAAKIAQGGKSSEQAFQATIAGLAAMEDPVKRNAAGVALFGTQWEDIGPKVVEAMAAGMNGVQGFEGATSRAATASFGLAGQWESMKRQVVGLLVDGITPLMPAITGFVSAGVAGITSMLGPIREISSALFELAAGGDNWGAAGEMLANFLPEDAVIGILGMVANIGSMFDAVFAGDIPGILEAAMGLIDGFGATIAGLVESWASSFASWVDGADTEMTGQLGEMMTNLMGWIQSGSAAIIERLAMWAGAFVDWVAPKIPPLLAALGALLVEVGTWIVTIGAPLVISKLLEWGAAFVAWVAPRIGPLLAALGGLLLALGGWLLGTALPAIVSQLLQWGAAFVEWVAPMIPELLLALAGLLVQLTLWIGQQVAGIGVALAAWGVAFIAWVATDVIPALPGALAGILSALTGWIGGAVGAIREGARGIGQAIIDGISAGISAGVGAIQSAAANAANSALSAAKAALGIESPSRRFNMEVGQEMMRGAIGGINVQRPALMAATKAAMVPAVKAAAEVVSSLSQQAMAMAEAARQQAEAASKATNISDFLDSVSGLEDVFGRGMSLPAPIFGPRSDEMGWHGDRPLPSPIFRPVTGVSDRPTAIFQPQPVVNLTVQGSLVHERELDRLIGNGLFNTLRRDGVGLGVR